MTASSMLYHVIYIHGRFKWPVSLACVRIALFSEFSWLYLLSFLVLFRLQLTRAKVMDTKQAGWTVNNSFISISTFSLFTLVVHRDMPAST